MLCPDPCRLPSRRHLNVRPPPREPLESHATGLGSQRGDAASVRPMGRNDTTEIRRLQTVVDWERSPAMRISPRVVMAFAVVTSQLLACNPSQPKFAFKHAERRGRLDKNGLRFVIMPDANTQL